MIALELGHKRLHFAFFKPKTQFFGGVLKSSFLIIYKAEIVQKDFQATYVVRTIVSCACWEIFDKGGTLT